MSVKLSEMIKIKRKEKSITQEELAQRLFVTRQTVSRWEQGHSYPSIETLIKLSDVLDFSLDAALKEDKNMTEDIIHREKINHVSKRVLLIIVPLFLILLCLFTVLLFNLNILPVKEKDISRFEYDEMTNVVTIELTEPSVWLPVSSWTDFDENESVATLTLEKQFNFLYVFNKNKEYEVTIPKDTEITKIQLENTQLSIDVKE